MKPIKLSMLSRKSAIVKRALLIACPPLILAAIVLVGFKSGPPTERGFNPESCFKGSPAFTLQVGGSNFVNGSVVQWNGVGLTTSFVSPTILNAQVPANDVANSGLFPVTVKNPDNSTSNSLNFHVYDPVIPQIYSLTPYVKVKNGGQFQMTVNGQGFNAASVVQWNGTGVATQFNSTRQLVATVPNSDLQTVGGDNITVFNPGLGGGTSNTVVFKVVRINVAVDINSFSFSPMDLTVTTGQTVIWTNNQAFVSHTVTRDVTTSPGPTSGVLATGNTYSFTIDPSIPLGTNIFYHCQFHGTAGNGTTFGTGMTGVLRVR